MVGVMDYQKVRRGERKTRDRVEGVCEKMLR